MKLPERIWLQYASSPMETTWCQDKINDDDAEYVSADKVRDAFKDLMVLIEEHGDRTLLAHATKILETRNILN